jgi:hypothetical protein
LPHFVGFALLLGRFIISMDAYSWTTSCLCVHTRRLLRALSRTMLSSPPQIFMQRYRLKELIAECNQNLAPEDRWNMQKLADTIGVQRSTLAGMSTFNRKPTTNTATQEALFRFFQLHHHDFHIADLFEFQPPLSETTDVEVDVLYPERAARREEGRRRARRRS